jgi:hypothetical protein
MTPEKSWDQYLLDQAPVSSEVPRSRRRLLVGGGG